jgi:hypothetical protein
VPRAIVSAAGIVALVPNAIGAAAGDVVMAPGGVDVAEGGPVLVVVVAAGTLVVRLDDVGVDATAAPIDDADAGALVAVVLGVVVDALAVGVAFAGGA